MVAIRDCKLSFLSREAFLNCLREYPEIYRDLVSTLVSRLREADEAMAAASFLTCPLVGTRPLFPLGWGRRRLHHVRWAVVKEMMGAWVLTLPATIVLGAAVSAVWQWAA